MLTFNHLIISVLSITFATITLIAALPNSEGSLQEELLQNLLSGKQDFDISYQQSQNAVLQDDKKDVADLQGIFNVLAQVKTEEAKAMDADSEATAQLWGLIGNIFWDIGTGFLRNKYCSSEEQQMQAMLQDLAGEQEASKMDVTEKESLALTQLQTLLSALNKVEAKMMHNGATNNVAMSEGQWERFLTSINTGLKKVTKTFLC